MITFDRNFHHRVSSIAFVLLLTYFKLLTLQLSHMCRWLHRRRSALILHKGRTRKTIPISFGPMPIIFRPRPEVQLTLNSLSRNPLSGLRARSAFYQRSTPDLHGKFTLMNARSLRNKTLLVIASTSAHLMSSSLQKLGWAQMDLYH